MGNLGDEGLDLNIIDRFPFGEPCDEFSLEPCLEWVDEATCNVLKKERLEEECEDLVLAETRLDLSGDVLIFRDDSCELAVESGAFFSFVSNTLSGCTSRACLNDCASHRGH